MSFAETLLAAARPFDMAASPFIERVRRGGCDRETLRRYAVTIYAMAARFPRNLSAVLSICEERAMRRFLLRNLAEEEGLVAFGPGGAAAYEDAMHHTELASRFARAAGATHDELAAAQAEPSRWFRAALEAGNWIGATAFFSVGVEANVPRTFSLLIDPLSRLYDFSSADLTFLTEHLGADERHGVEAAELIAGAASTEAMRGQALEGARRGGRSWWNFHRLAA